MQGISKNLMVTLRYDLHIEDENGQLIEKTTDEQPLQFLFGAGEMLPKFESQLEGLQEGEDFTIRLAKDEAYGDVNEDAIVDLPKHVFVVDGKIDEELIAVGNVVPMMSSNGQRLNGQVLNIDDDTVKMDFNHPLAGEDLFFAGKILGVRQPSDEELAQHLSGGGCGCGSGGCGEGDCETHEHDQNHGCGCGC